MVEVDKLVGSVWELTFHETFRSPWGSVEVVVVVVVVDDDDDVVVFAQNNSGTATLRYSACPRPAAISRHASPQYGPEQGFAGLRFEVHVTCTCSKTLISDHGHRPVPVPFSKNTK